MRQDYRVRVIVEFSLELGAVSKNDAMLNAEKITAIVFSDSFRRARVLNLNAEFTDRIQEQKSESRL